MRGLPHRAQRQRAEARETLRRALYAERVQAPSGSGDGGQPGMGGGASDPCTLFIAASLQCGRIAGTPSKRSWQMGALLETAAPV